MDVGVVMAWGIFSVDVGSVGWILLLMLELSLLMFDVLPQGQFVADMFFACLRGLRYSAHA